MPSTQYSVAPGGAGHRRAPGPRRPRQPVVVAVAAVLGAALVGGAVVAAGSWSAAHESGSTAQETAVPFVPRFGVISGPNAPEASAANLSAERAAGIEARTFELVWMYAEPRAGVFDERYLQRKQEELRRYREQGFAVALDLGVHYPPEWAHRLSPGAEYRNQFGETYQSEQDGKKIVNTVFDGAVRAAVAEYTDRVFAEFGTDFDAIRVGGGGNGELQYPQGGFNGRPNPLWAYDPVAQGEVPGLAEGVPVNPVPGWRPGDPDPGNEKAGAFYRWYIGALATWQNWQIEQYRSRGFTGDLYVMVGAYGMRNGTVNEPEDAIAHGLEGCEACDRQTLSSGQDWAALVAALPPDPRVLPYTTWADGPAEADDTSADPGDWSPVKYLASVARANGRQVGGENAGDADVPRMQRAMEHLREHELVVLYWYSEPQLFEGEFVSLRDLGGAIAAVPR